MHMKKMLRNRNKVTAGDAWQSNIALKTSFQAISGLPTLRTYVTCPTDQSDSNPNLVVKGISASHFGQA